MQKLYILFYNFKNYYIIQLILFHTYNCIIIIKIIIKVNSNIYLRVLNNEIFKNKKIMCKYLCLFKGDENLKKKINIPIYYFKTIFSKLFCCVRHPLILIIWRSVARVLQAQKLFFSSHE